MLGAIVGDIAGATYEGIGVKALDFPLFSPGSRFSDDTVMTVAVAAAILAGGEAGDYVAALKEYGRLYPEAGYGARFRRWLFSASEEPYNSWGNGSAMRVSPVAWAYSTLAEVEEKAKISAAVTHNHPEGIKGAQAVAAAIFMARKGERRKDIKAYLTDRYGYNLDPAPAEIRSSSITDLSCQKTVPAAFSAFYESKGFDDALRKAISLGGDSDTIAAISGGIAQGAFGIPEAIATKAWSYLDEKLAAVQIGRAHV